MLDTSTKFTVRFSAEIMHRVEKTAAERRCSPSEVIRRAVDQYLLGQIVLTQSDLRHHRISEYSQVALDTIVREQHPEFHERILAETNRRMGVYHGAR